MHIFLQSQPSFFGSVDLPVVEFEIETRLTGNQLAILYKTLKVAALDGRTRRLSDMLERSHVGIYQQTVVQIDIGLQVSPSIVG
jgi:hypothetical protein